MRLPRLWVVSSVLLVVAAGIAICAGATFYSPMQAWKAITHTSDNFTASIIMDIRIPRVICAAAVGASLAMAGVVLQATYANPLVDAGLVGVSAAAGIGAAITSIAIGVQNQLLVALGAVVTAIAISLVLSRTKSRGLTFILIGVAVGSAMTSVLGTLASIPATSMGRSVASWVFGSFALADWHSATVVLLGLVAGALVLARQGWGLEVSGLGSRQAEALGLNLFRSRIRWSIAGALLVAPATAMFGVVGFVGLAVPHLARLLGARSATSQLVASGFGGAILTVVADVVVRVSFRGVEVPVGLILSLIGASVLISRLRGRSHEL